MIMAQEATPALGGPIKLQLQPADFVMVQYLVSWTLPNLSGGIDYIGGDDTGEQYFTKADALMALEKIRHQQPDAYLVRVTYEREDLRAQAAQSQPLPEMAVSQKWELNQAPRGQSRK
jgi:hypothetical protein